MTGAGGRRRSPAGTDGASPAEPDGASPAEPDGAGLSGATTLPGLDPAQQRLVRQWLPDAHLVADLSWGLIDSTVLHVRAATREAIVKAGGPDNHHLPRELAAYHRWVGVLQEHSAAPALWHTDAEARLFVTEYLPGDLVQGHPAEADPASYRAAGKLLALLHGQDQRVDTQHNTTARDQALRWLAHQHRIEAKTVRRLRTVLADHPTGPVTVVPTHGDYTPRNWLTHRGRLTVIDFGRAGWRPAQTDLARLHARQFRTDAALEPAFLDGYGTDPREARSWQYLLLTEAIGAAVWSYQVGAEAFEAEGHRGIAAALERFGA